MLNAVFIFMIGFTAHIASGQMRYTQMVIPVPPDASVKFQSIESLNTLRLQFTKTELSALDVLDKYDDRLIRRVIIKSLGAQGITADLHLVDANLHATVYEFDEPRRVVVDIYDKGYRPPVDPSTKLPTGGLWGESTTTGAPLYKTHELGRHEVSPETQASARAQAAVTSNSPEPIARLSPEVASENSKEWQLLAPNETSIASSPKLKADLNDIPSGRGKSWAEYPRYIYPIQTAAYQSRLNQTKWTDAEVSAAVSSSQALAEYAFKLFSFGHEARAIAAYQKVIQTRPAAVLKTPLHIWALGEAYLGNGNTFLADSYYALLQDKHPDSPLSSLAALRQLDKEAIENHQSGKPGPWNQLLSRLAVLGRKSMGETAALVSIRRVWWAQKDPNIELPFAQEDQLPELRAALPTSESQKTAFVIHSLLLHADLQRGWQKSTGDFAAEYFRRYKGPASEPWAQILRDQLESVLVGQLEKLNANDDSQSVITLYQDLPRSLKSISKKPQAAWALAESYRNLGQEDASLPFYLSTSQPPIDEEMRLKSLFWRSLFLGRKGRRDRDTNARSSAVQADRQALSLWNAMSEEKKSRMRTSYRDHLVDAVTDPVLLRTPPTILLDSYDKTLSTTADANIGGTLPDWSRLYSATTGAIGLIADLRSRFGRLGMKTELNRAQDLLLQFDPTLIASENRIRESWINIVQDIADSQRKANQFLQAGRTYGLLAEKIEDWDQRAETLYKSGLLLYRAGRREEAIESFRKASLDGNNLFYANLAKERLAQIQQ